MFTLEPLKSGKLPEFSSLSAHTPDSAGLPGDAERSGARPVPVCPTVPPWLWIPKEFKRHYKLDAVSAGPWAILPRPNPLVLKGAAQRPPPGERTSRSVPGSRRCFELRGSGKGRVG